MPAPQGLFEFGGIRGRLSAGMTLSLGTSPNVATMYIAPQQSPPPANGTLSLVYDGGGLSFPDCLVTDINFDVRQDGFVVWALSIADCRWRWQYPVISGEFNIRRDDQNINPLTTKSAREMAVLLFEKLDFPKADVSKVPNDVFPETHWEYTRVDSALTDLLEPLGLRVRLLPGNRVSVVEIGVGASLPSQGVLSYSITVKPPERPDSLVFVAGRSMWQHDFKLWAVGRDLDGSWKLIDNLSYKPQAGWEYFDADRGHHLSDSRAMKLAKDTVFKCYAIELPFKLPVSDDPEQDVEVKFGELWRVLPMGDRQLEKTKFVAAKDPNHEETLPPWIYGQYYSEGAASVNNVERREELTGNVEEFPSSLYVKSFNFDPDRGLVTFDDPVFKVGPATSYGVLHYPAELYLRTSCPLRDPKTRQFYHYEVERKLPGRKLGTAPKYIIKDDVAAHAGRRWVNGKQVPVGNLKNVLAHANHYLDAEQAALQVDSPEKAAYGGFRDIQLDGAVQQVTWQVSEQGFATTVAARNNEIPTYAPTFLDKRLNQQGRAVAAFNEAIQLREKKRGLR